jgi:hypothetical protein
VKTNNSAFNGQKEHKFCNNYGNKVSLSNSLLVSTAKYNAVTFVPQNLAEQFMRLANVYFLVISLLQIFSGLNLTEKVNTAVPLACVVIFQMIKDGFEDMVSVQFGTHSRRNSTLPIDKSIDRKRRLYATENCKASHGKVLCT